MRTPLLAILFLVAAPPTARASASLVAREGGPAARLEVPELALAPAPALALARDAGGGAPARGRGGYDPVLSLVLGVLPGFGIGHVLAGSSAWPIWMVVDVALLAGVVVADGDAETILILGTIAERVLEGIDAYRQAQGQRGLFGARGAGPPALAAIPAGSRNLVAAAASGLRF
jgi:hypothetical protein